MSAMLASLRIRNLALVEDITWEPKPGFLAITGETGAGKSILIGALKLIIGERADKSLIRSGAESCSVEAAFDVPLGSPLHQILEEQGVEPCEDETLLIRRTFSTGGSGKQFVNGSACTLGLLRDLGDRLVDLHGPHDHQSLFSRTQQTLLLDAFAGAGELRAKYLETRRHWMDLTAEQEDLTRDEQSAAREIDLLTHQVREIETARLEPDEEEPLVARQRSASNAKRLGELSAEMLARVTESDDSIVSRLGETNRLARELSRIDPAAESLASACLELTEAAADLGRQLETYSANLEADPARLAEIEARLDAIQLLKRKYGRTVDEVIAFGQSAAQRLAAIQSRDERRQDLGKKIDEARKDLLSAGAGLTSRRKQVAPKLAKAAREHLSDLGFLRSEFSINLEPQSEPGPEGCEIAEFLFAPNPGEPAQPLRSIASSGEISRVMLALKTALAAQDGVPVLVFDEIDANVGGETGAKVGAKMHELGETRQVFCITHLPQVAAAAAAHYIVVKEVRGGRTSTKLTESAGSEREQELARMLGGRTESALAHAREMLVRV